MKSLDIPKTTYKQNEILDLLYTHRFLTRVQIQTFLKHKDKKTISVWLRDLRAKEYIKWIYNKDHFAEKTKPAIYYLGINGLRRQRFLDFHSSEQISKRYREHKRSQTFIDRCLTIADVAICLDAARDEASYPQTWYCYETEADYQSDSNFQFLAKNELIHPHFCFLKFQYDGTDEPSVVKSYLLEVFDATLPRYRMRKRLNNYVKYLNEELDGWSDETGGEPPPDILLVCSSLTDLIYAKRRTRGLLAIDWEKDDQERPRLLFTTSERLKERGCLGDIWERA